MASPRDESMEALNEGLSDLKVSEEKLSGADKDSDLDLEKGKEGNDVLRPPRFPQRTGQPDCTYYLKYGSCRFGMKCKFNHPPKRKHNNSNNKAKMNKASESGQDDLKAKEVLSEYIELKEHEVNADENCKDVTSHELQGLLDTVMRGPLKKKNESNVSALFIGWWDSSNAISDDSTVPVSDTATKAKDKESTSEGAVQECKFFHKPGGCKFGKSCKYIHMEGKADIPLVELNFLGLPLRPGEKECPYYMRNSSCKYATNCKFHHPDPSAVPPKEENPNPNPNYNYNNRSNDNNSDEPEPPREMAQGTEGQVPPVPVQSWPEQRTLKEPAPYIIAPPSYMPGLIPHHGYQVPVGPYFMPVQNYPPPSAMHHHHQQGSFEEYPERPGQPECQHFLKMGFCKYKLACKYHHPRLLIAPPGILSPVGLPLKPDQPVCVYYGRYGVCKYGPACKFDHPLNYGPRAPQTR